MRLWPISFEAYKRIPEDQKGTVAHSGTGWPIGTHFTAAAFVPGRENDNGTNLVPVLVVPFMFEKHRVECERAADMIQSAFMWDKTAEGRNYWSQVVSKLRAFADADQEALKRDIIQEGKR